MMKLALVFNFLLITPQAVVSNKAEIPQDDGPSSSIAFCAIGDWGGQGWFPYTTYGQKETARGMGKVAEEIQSKFVVALGDNFYRQGVQSSSSFRFDWTFEDVYSADSLTRIPWYAIGGNHDHYGNITAQIDYSNPNGRWKFPSLYHSQNFQSADGSVTLDLVLIDTVELCGLNQVQDENDPAYFDPLPLLEKSQAQAQWDWIEKMLNGSTADYLLVGGHYPVYSVCSHGPTETLIEHLRPLLLQYGAHYLSGHDHCMVHLQEEGVHHVLTGMGHECCYEATNLGNHMIPTRALQWFLSKENKDLYQAIGGFTSVQANDKEMKIKYHDQRGNVLFTADSIPPRRKN